MKRATQSAAIISTAMFVAFLAFVTIDLGAHLFGWQVGVILELSFIGFGMFFFWEFRHYFRRKLHL